jgi:O-antigen/teichoic acid export membrane protein
VSDTKNALATLAKGAGISFIGVMITKASGYIYKLLTANMLGSELYGTLSLGIMAFSIITTFVMLGIPSGVTRFMSKYRSEDDEKRLQGVFNASMEITVATSILAAIVLFLGAGPISNYIFDAPELVPVLQIISLAIPFNALSSNMTSISIGFKKIRYKIYIRNITESFVKIGVTAALLYLGLDLQGASIGFAAGWIAAGIVGLLLIEKKLFPFIRGNIEPVKEHRELLMFSTPLILSSVFGQITSWADVFLVGYFQNPAQVGLYTAALPTAMLISVVPAALGSLSVPVMTEFYTKNKLQPMKETYQATTKWILAATFPAFMLMALFSETGLRVLFTPEYLTENATLLGMTHPTTAWALSILAFGYLAFSATGISRQIIQSTAETKYNLYIGATIGMANLGLNLVLIPYMGIVGASIATATSWIIGSLARIIIVKNLVGFHPFRKSILKIALSSIIAAATVFAITKYFYTTTPKWVLIPALIGFGLIYITILLATKTIEEEDKMLVKAIEDKTGIEIPYTDEILEKFS